MEGSEVEEEMYVVWRSGGRRKKLNENGQQNGGRIERREVRGRAIRMRGREGERTDNAGKGRRE